MQLHQRALDFTSKWTNGRGRTGQAELGDKPSQWASLRRNALCEPDLGIGGKKAELAEEYSVSITLRHISPTPY